MRVMSVKAKKHIAPVIASITTTYAINQLNSSNLLLKAIKKQPVMKKNEQDVIYLVIVALVRGIN